MGESAGSVEARPGIAHIPALDGLRGAAVAGVLIYHLGHLKGGYLGVDLFFVLSGYLITSLLLAEHRSTGRIDLGAFWGRRARRLVPALWLLLMGVAVYAVVVARPIDLPALRLDAFATIAYLANWHTIAGGASYWNISLAPSPLQHTWSLAIEEQFYLVWPLLFAYLVVRARHGRASLSQTVLRVAAVGAIVSAGGLVLLHQHGASDTRLYEGTDTRAAALLLGVALAAWRARAAERGERRSPTAVVRADRAVEWAGVGATLVLGLLWLTLDGRSPWVYRGGLATASILATIAVAAASRPSSSVVGRLFAIRPLRWLGAISYGLYLWHWPIYQGLDAVNGRFPGLGRRHLVGNEMLVAKLGLSLLVAVASFLLLEQPLRRAKLPKRIGPLAVGAGMVTAALAVFVATLGGVAPDPIAPPSGTRLAHVDGAPVVWVAGDSVALSVASRLYADPARYQVNPVDHTRIGCSFAATGRPVRSFAGARIRPASCQQYALAGIEQAKPDIVYLLVGSRPNDSIQLGGTWTRACDPAYDANYRSTAIDLLRRFRASGAQVVVGTVLHSGSASLPVEGSEARIDCVNRVIESLPAAVAGVHVVDTNQLLCPGPGACVEELGGAPVRTDGLHFDRGPGGDRVVDWIMAKVHAAVPTKPESPSSSLARTAVDIPEHTLQWLNRVSEQALGRAMDSQGARFWGSNLVKGTPRAVVARSIVETASWRRQRVVAAYQRWLLRDPSPDRLDHFARWLETHTTSELDLRLATSEEGRVAAGRTDEQRGRHLARALNLSAKALPHFERQFADGMHWNAVVRDAYFTRFAANRRMTDLAPRSTYTPDLDVLVADFQTTGDERTPLVKALATLAV